MLISYTWLTALLDLPGEVPAPAELAKLLTGLGLEVEAVHAKGVGLETILVGEIRGKSPHPQASKLTVVELFDGQQTLTVVCGASNLPGIGGKVAFAPIGATLPGGLEIAARELRGVASQGMICSETELDIGAEGDGILILPEDLPAGTPLHYIFSKNQATIDYVLRSLSFGGGCVNQTNLHCWIDSLPFGGVGYSGMGKYYGKAGFDALSNTKALLIGNPDLELDVFPPYAGKDIAKNLSVFS